jgi:hypothetical protein
LLSCQEEKISRLSGFDENEILELLYLVLKYCIFFDEEDIAGHIKKQAFVLLKDNDPKHILMPEK